jgi:hypothetical protein
MMALVWQEQGNMITANVINSVLGSRGYVTVHELIQINKRLDKIKADWEM